MKLKFLARSVASLLMTVLIAFLFLVLLGKKEYKAE